MQSNPYVYPYTPFQNLAQPVTANVFADATAKTTDDIRRLLGTQSFPLVTPLGTTIDEQLLSIFLDDHVRFGSRDLIEVQRDTWLKKIHVFTETNSPVVFTILGFPFKIPVPLKTNRTMPDMGEVLSLHRLAQIGREVKKVYEPGARIVVFAEGAFGPFVGLSADETKRYVDVLREFVNDFSFSDVLEIRELSEMEVAPDFAQRFTATLAEFREQHNKRDPSFMAKFDGAYTSVLRIVSTRGIDEQLLMEVYNDNLADEAVSAEALKIRVDMRARATESVLNYHAYLSVRDQLGFLSQAVPNALALTVSPKPGRLGVIPVNEQSIRLPYHAVPVLHTDGTFTLEYLVDIKRSSKPMTPVFWERDHEEVPFYYEA